MAQEDISKIFVGNQFKQFRVYSFVHDETNKKITLNLHRHENMPYTDNARVFSVNLHHSKYYFLFCIYIIP